MAAPKPPTSASSGVSSIVDAKTGAVSLAPALVRPVRSTLTLAGVSDPGTLYRVLGALQRELDETRERTRSVLHGAIFVQGIAIGAGSVVLVDHRLGRVPIGVILSPPRTSTATALAGVAAVAQVDLPTGRDARQWIALACRDAVTVDALIF